jgi:methionyl-tRNA formyltransferase
MIIILSTDTIHHRYFISEIYKSHKNLLVIFEKKIKSKFSTNHQIDRLTKNYEKSFWQNFTINKKNLVPKNKFHYFEDVNSKETFNLIKNSTFRCILSFGTKKIGKKLIKLSKNKIFNLHGGDPEFYRGLDSHFWAIYHNDFKNLTTTLHVLNENLDTGNIYKKKKIKIKKYDDLSKLRLKNTSVCVDLFKNFLSKLQKNKKIKFYKQKKEGRYYSFMPSVLKNRVLINYNKYILSLRRKI